MTITVQDVTPSLISTRWTVGNPTKIAAATATVECIGMSKDRKWLFGSDRSGGGINILKMTSEVGANIGTNWQAIHTFNFTGSNTEVITGMIECADGEVLVSTRVGITSACIYRSTGWGATLAQKQAATWAMVYQTPGGSFTNVWGFRQSCVGTGADANNIVVSTYGGGQTGAGGVATAANQRAARYVFRSTDGGFNWAIEYDIFLQPQAYEVAGVHVHASLRHSAWARDWWIFGDGNSAQTVAGQDSTPRNRQFIGYKDDDGTIQYLPTPDLLAGVVCQFTGLAVTDKAVIFGVDAVAPTMHIVYPITGYRTLGEPIIDFILHVNTPYVKCFESAGNGFPLLRGDAPASSGSAPNQLVQYPEIFASSDGGLSWHIAYTDKNAVAGASGFFAALCGPTFENKMIAEYENGYLVGDFTEVTT